MLEDKMSKRAPQFLQHLLLAAGILLLSVYFLARVDAWVSSRRALRAFDLAVAAGSPRDDSSTKRVPADDPVDFSLWSEKRIRDYKQSQLVETQLPWGVLSIDKLRIRVPVFDGTDDLVLNRGAGWIAGTARPGDAGNIGIAGHRDGFFRGLKDIVAGDEVTLTTPQEQATYIVDQIEIVSPERVEVLQARRAPSLTLVTCYPFYFVGDAPQRFIVHATLTRTVATKPVEGGGRRGAGA